MSFSPTVRTQALVAAARHCCVCHRYKGVKIEVHHIEQEADGGANTLDNAIALCFDCHTDAGHYNIHHPKGSKFSPEELRLARDTWHGLVRSNNIQEPIDGTDELHIQYLICRDSLLSQEIIHGDLREIPATSALLFENGILDSFKTLFKLHDELYQDIHSWGGSFPDADAYLKHYPDAVPTDRYDSNDPYFDTTRIPDVSELGALSKKGSLISNLLNNGLTVRDFLKAVAYAAYCGGHDGEHIYNEALIFRQLWPVFLHISNKSQSPVQLQELKGKHSGTVTQARFFASLDNQSQPYSRPLPAVSLLPGQTVLIPVMLTLAPLKNLNDTSTPIASNTALDSTVTLLLNNLHSGQDQFIVLGTYLLPEEIAYQTGTVKKSSGIHALDLTRTYTLNRDWQIGSCPHLFFEDEHGLRYVRELFSRLPNETSTEVIHIPDGVTKLIIAELEDEETIIEEIQINGISVRSKCILRTNDTLSHDVKQGDAIVITGRYITSNLKPAPFGIQYRNTLIGRFLRMYKEKEFDLRNILNA